MSWALDAFHIFPAVIITALIGGRGAGVFSVVLSTAAVMFLQMPPLTLLLFALLAIFLVILITRTRLAIQREQAAQHVQDSKDRLRFALDAALLGWWLYDPIRRVVSGDTRFKEVFDVTADETPAAAAGFRHPRSPGSKQDGVD
jgi:PAS domain-containing protein